MTVDHGWSVGPIEIEPTPARYGSDVAHELDVHVTQPRLRRGTGYQPDGSIAAEEGAGWPGTASAIVTGLRLLGLVGLQDPPPDGVAEAIAACRSETHAAGR